MLRVLLALLAMAMVLGPGLILGGDFILSRLLLFGARTVGGLPDLKDLSVRLVDLSTDRLVLRDVVIGGPQGPRIAKLALEFELRELVGSRRLRVIDARGLQFNLTTSDESGGTAVVGLPTPSTTEYEESDPAGWRIDELEVRETRIGLLTAAGQLDMAVNARATDLGPSGGEGVVRYRFVHQADLGGNGVRIDGAGSGSFTLTDTRAWFVDLTAESVSLRAPTVEIALEGGHGRVRGSIGGDVTELSGLLTATSLRVGQEIVLEPTARGAIDLDGLMVEIAVPRADIDGEFLQADLKAALPERGRSRFSFQASADAGWLERLAARVVDWEPARLSGAIRVHARGTMPVSELSTDSILGGITATGRVGVRVSGAGNAAILRPRLEGTVDLGLAAGRLTLDGAGPMILSAEHLRANKLGIDLSDELARLSSDGPTLQLGATGLGWSASAVPGEAGYRVNLRAPLRFAAAHLRDGRADLRASFNWPLGKGGSVRLERFDGVVRRLGMRRARLRDLTWRFQGELAPERTEGRFSLSTGITVRQPELAVDGRLGIAGRLRVTPEGGTVEARSAELALASLSLPGEGLSLAAPTHLELAEPGRIAASRAAGISASAEITPTKFSVDLRGRPLQLSFSKAVLDHDASGTRLVLSLSEVELPNDSLRASISDLAIRLSSVLALEKVSIGGGRLEDRSEKPRFPPVTLEARGQVAPSDTDRINIVFQASSFEDAVRAVGEAYHHWAAGAGEMRFRGEPIELAGIAPAEFDLARWIESWSGTLTPSGRAAWTTDQAVELQLDLGIAGVALEGPIGSVQGMAGTVALSGPTPWRTAGVQSIAAERLDLGVILSSAMAQIELAPDGRLRLPVASAALAGGGMTLRAVTIDPKTGLVSGRVDLDKVNLQPLAELARLDGLSATGAISGQLPFTWHPETGVSLPSSTLAAIGPGIVRYDPDPPPAALASAGEQVELMLQAVRNFHYSGLSVTLEGEPGQDVHLKIALAGSNPDLHGGHPLEFNLNLSGQLDDIFGAALKTYRLPETLRERIKERVGG